MTRFALRALVNGEQRQYGTAADQESAEAFRGPLQSALGVPVWVDELPAHPPACVDCCPPAAVSEGREEVIELPNGSVLRLRTAGDVVLFIERDDESADGSAARWWLPSGDPLTWEQVWERLGQAGGWRVVTAPAVPVADALTRLRDRFEQAMRLADAATPGAARADQVQVALFVERAAQTLAEAAGLETVDWSRRGAEPAPAAAADDVTQVIPLVVDAPTEVIPPVVDAPTELIPPQVLRRSVGSLRQALKNVAGAMRSAGALPRHRQPVQFAVGRAGGKANEAKEWRWSSATEQGRRNNGGR